MQFLAVLLIAFAVVMAMPAEEAVVGDFAEAQNFNPEDPQEFFKLKKFKKLFLGWALASRKPVEYLPEVMKLTIIENFLHHMCFAAQRFCSIFVY